MKRFAPMLVLLTIVSLDVIADTTVHRSFAKDNGAQLRCRNASTFERYEESLRDAGWGRAGEPAPRLDFSVSTAIIIAPQTFRSRHEINVTSIDEEAEKVVVRWSWRAVSRQGSENVGGSSASHGSTYEGPEVVIVTLPRALLSGKKLSCAGPKV